MDYYEYTGTVDEMRWDGIGSDGMGWDVMGSDEIR